VYCALQKPSSGKSKPKKEKGPSFEDIQKAEIDRNVRYLQQLHNPDAAANVQPVGGGGVPGKPKRKGSGKGDGSHRLGGVGGTGVAGTGPGGHLKQTDAVRDKRAAYFERMFADGDPA
jgi:hypothetical protein